MIMSAESTAKRWIHAAAAAFTEPPPAGGEGRRGSAGHEGEQAALPQHGLSILLLAVCVSMLLLGVPLVRTKLLKNTQELGMALAEKMNKSSARVYTVMGDGELAEGSVWEGAWLPPSISWITCAR